MSLGTSPGKRITKTPEKIAGDLFRPEPLPDDLGFSIYSVEPPKNELDDATKKLDDYIASMGQAQAGGIAQLKTRMGSGGTSTSYRQIPDELKQQIAQSPEMVNRFVGESQTETQGLDLMRQSELESYRREMGGYKEQTKQLREQEKADLGRVDEALNKTRSEMKRFELEPKYSIASQVFSAFAMALGTLGTGLTQGRLPNFAKQIADEVVMRDTMMRQNKFKQLALVNDEIRQKRAEMIQRYGSENAMIRADMADTYQALSVGLSQNDAQLKTSQQRLANNLLKYNADQGMISNKLAIAPTIQKQSNWQTVTKDVPFGGMAGGKEVALKPDAIKSHEVAKGNLGVINHIYDLARQSGLTKRNLRAHGLLGQRMEDWVMTKEGSAFSQTMNRLTADINAMKGQGTVSDFERGLLAIWDKKAAMPWNVEKFLSRLKSWSEIEVNKASRLAVDIPTIYYRGNPNAAILGKDLLNEAQRTKENMEFSTRDILKREK